MALKDQLTDALNSTPADNTRRIATLREVLAAAEAREGATDADISAIIARIITEREQRAASFSSAGQSDLAKAERGEIGTLRSFLHATTPVEPTAAPKKVKAEVAKDCRGLRADENPIDHRRRRGRRRRHCGHPVFLRLLAPVPTTECC